MPGAEGGLGAAPAGHRPRNEENSPSEGSNQSPSALQRWSPGTGSHRVAASGDGGPGASERAASPALPHRLHPE